MTNQTLPFWLPFPPPQVLTPAEAMAAAIPLGILPPNYTDLFHPPQPNSMSHGSSVASQNNNSIQMKMGFTGVTETLSIDPSSDMAKANLPPMLSFPFPPPPALLQNLHTWSSMIDPGAFQALCKRRGRQTYTRHQTIELENEFQRNAYLTRARRIVISQTLDLTERQIKIWFQNRRMKQKREKQHDRTNAKETHNKSNDIISRVCCSDTSNTTVSHDGDQSSIQKPGDADQIDVSN